MVEEQKDPMEPPKFKINQKIPRAPASPPAPVMHSPPRKVTTKEQNDWKIPPCTSNWKNPKGLMLFYSQPYIQDSLYRWTRDLLPMVVDFNKRILTKTLPNSRKLSTLLIAKLVKPSSTALSWKDVWHKTRNSNRRRRCDRWLRKPERFVFFMFLFLVSFRSIVFSFQERNQLGRGGKDDEDDAAKERDELRRDRLDDHRKNRNIEKARPEKSSKLRR